MIVDDEAEVRTAITHIIDWEALGFEIVADAENGVDALEKAEALDLDVVLTDIKMPFMDGLALGAELSRRRPGLKLLIFSGFDAFEYAQEAIKLNVVEYVLKPVNAAELTAVLGRVRDLLDAEIAGLPEEPPPAAGKIPPGVAPGAYGPPGSGPAGRSVCSYRSGGPF